MIEIVRSVCAASVTLGYSALLAEAQEQPAEPLLGQWSAPCDAWGVPATCTSVWTTGKHLSHLVQEYSITRKTDQAQIFAGRGVYRIDGDDVLGTWEDSQGSIHQLAGSYIENVLKVTWGSVATEIGVSEYAFKDDTLSVQDAVLTDHGWRPFMTVSYVRVD